MARNLTLPRAVACFCLGSGERDQAGGHMKGALPSDVPSKSNEDQSGGSGPEKPHDGLSRTVLLLVHAVKQRFQEIKKGKKSKDGHVLFVFSVPVSYKLLQRET